MKHLNNFLFAPANDIPPAGGGVKGAEAPSSPEKKNDLGQDQENGEGGEDDTDEEEPAPIVEPPPAPAGRLGFFDKGRALLLGKPELVGKIQGLTSQLQAANATIAGLRGEIQQLTAAVDSVPKLEKQISELQAEQKTVASGVADELAALGVPAAAAPGLQAFEESGSEMLAHYKTLKGAERTAYFRQHQKALFAAEKAASK